MDKACNDNCQLCLAQKDKYEVGDLVALKTAPLRLEHETKRKHVNGLVVRLKRNEIEELAVIRLIGSEAINGLERVFSHKDIYYLNKTKCSSV